MIKAVPIPVNSGMKVPLNKNAEMKHTAPVMADPAGLPGSALRIPGKIRAPRIEYGTKDR